MELDVKNNILKKTSRITSGITRDHREDNTEEDDDGHKY
jgi:hypothetical protein